MNTHIEINCNEYIQYIHFFRTNKNTDLSLVQIGCHLTSPSYGFGPKVRDHYLIHFIHSGKGSFRIHNKNYSVTEGQCFLIEPHQIAYYESDYETPLKYYWIGFEGHLAESYINDIGFSLQKPIIHLPSLPIILNEFDKLNSLGYKKENFLAYQALLYNILFYLTQTSRITSTNIPLVSSPKLSYGDYVQYVLDIIQSSYKHNISISDIANDLNIDRSYLSKIFKQHIGTSIKQYLIDYKLNQSLILLKDSNRNISQIALEVGFQDSLYFSKLFHKKYSVSPSEYRKNLIITPL